MQWQTRPHIAHIAGHAIRRSAGVTGGAVTIKALTGRRQDEGVLLAIWQWLGSNRRATSMMACNRPECEGMNGSYIAYKLQIAEALLCGSFYTDETAHQQARNTNTRTHLRMRCILACALNNMAVWEIRLCLDDLAFLRRSCTSWTMHGQVGRRFEILWPLIAITVFVFGPRLTCFQTDLSPLTTTIRLLACTWAGRFPACGPQNAPLRCHYLWH
jgi:hypothetical protein